MTKKSLCLSNRRDALAGRKRRTLLLRYSEPRWLAKQIVTHIHSDTSSGTNNPTILICRLSMSVQIREIHPNAIRLAVAIVLRCSHDKTSPSKKMPRSSARETNSIWVPHDGRPTNCALNLTRRRGMKTNAPISAFAELDQTTTVSGIHTQNPAVMERRKNQWPKVTITLSQLHRGALIAVLAFTVFACVGAGVANAQVKHVAGLTVLNVQEPETDVDFVNAQAMQLPL